MPVPHPFQPPDRKAWTEPDYLFSLANEGTFLAWIRTSSALVGGGLAVVAFLPASRLVLLVVHRRGRRLGLAGGGTEPTAG